jgi:deoxyadenosine/deoxycytidine kinase
VHIAVAGNIGAGKTTLTNMLADHYGWEKRLEPVVENPYMEDYYSDIKRWSFAMEVFFLKERFRDVLDVAKSDHTIIQDGSIFEGVYVFTENNYRQGNLSETDFKTYMELFELMVRVTKYPDLLIYLRKSVPQLVRQIQLRGREYEQTMQLEYLKGLNERYEDFIFNRYKGRVLVIESDGMDFQHNPKDFGKIIDKIDAELFGLFSHVEKSLFAEKGL